MCAFQVRGKVNPIDILSSPSQQRAWHKAGLSRDVEARFDALRLRSLCLHQDLRWCLLYDPDDQAVTWLHVIFEQLRKDVESGSFETRMVSCVESISLYARVIGASRVREVWEWRKEGEFDLQFALAKKHFTTLAYFPLSTLIHPLTLVNFSPIFLLNFVHQRECAMFIKAVVLLFSKKARIIGWLALKYTCM